MKLLLRLVFCMIAVSCDAQVGVLHVSRPPERQPTWQEIQDAKAADVAEKQKYFIPRDPWRTRTFSVRMADGIYVTSTETNYAKGPEWYQFYGIVQQVNHDHVIIKGWWGPPLDFEHGTSNTTFRVKNFPFKAPIGTELRATG